MAERFVADIFNALDEQTVVVPGTADAGTLRRQTGGEDHLPGAVDGPTGQALMGGLERAELVGEVPPGRVGAVLPAIASRVRQWSAHRRTRSGSAGISGSIRSHIASVIANRTEHIRQLTAAEKPPRHTAVPGACPRCQRLGVAAATERLASRPRARASCWRVVTPSLV